MKFNDQQISIALDYLENGFFGLIAEEFLIRVGRAREYYFHLQRELVKFSDLCRASPQKLCQLEKEWKETKKKIAEEMLKLSLLDSANDSNSKTLSGDPFTLFKQPN